MKQFNKTKQNKTSRHVSRQTDKTNKTKQVNRTKLSIILSRYTGIVRNIIIYYPCAFLKVKCNEIWTIFLFSNNLHKKVSYTNKKQNQLLKVSFVRAMAPKTRKSDDFRELHENQPEMAALGVETKL